MNEALLYPLLGCLSIAVALNLVLTFRLAAMLRLNMGQTVVPLTLPFGEPVPDYIATSIVEGKPVNTRQQSCVLLFLSSTCKDCKAKVPQLAQLQPALEHAGVAMWLVSAESKKRLENLLSGSDLLNRTVTMPTNLMKTLNPRHASPFYLFIDEQQILQASGMIGDDNWLSFIDQMQQIEQQAGLTE
ncbi:MAG: hypothetical protein ACI8WB_002049 [Phenylobacterium sp.]|jgi:hypothetical protein